MEAPNRLPPTSSGGLFLSMPVGCKAMVYESLVWLGLPLWTRLFFKHLDILSFFFPKHAFYWTNLHHGWTLRIQYSLVPLQFHFNSIVQTSTVPIFALSCQHQQLFNYIILYLHKFCIREERVQFSYSDWCDWFSCSRSITPCFGDAHRTGHPVAVLLRRLARLWTHPTRYARTSGQITITNRISWIKMNQAAESHRTCAEAQFLRELCQLWSTHVSSIMWLPEDVGYKMNKQARKLCWLGQWGSKSWKSTAIILSWSVMENFSIGTLPTPPNIFNMVI